MNMQKVFLDTNVLLDYLFDREEFAQDAAAILAVGQEGKVSLCVSALTFANIAYIARRKYKGVSLYALLKDIRKMCEVAPVDETVIDNALLLQAHDFEDAIQYCFSTSGGVRLHRDAQHKGLWLC